MQIFGGRKALKLASSGATGAEGEQQKRESAMERPPPTTRRISTTPKALRRRSIAVTRFGFWPFNRAQISVMHGKVKE